MTTAFYTMNDYNSFDKMSLSSNVISVIQYLTNKFGGLVTTEIRPREKKYKSNQKNDSWASMRDFKPTVIMEKIEGVDQLISEIRGALNKISVKNYDTNRNLIVEKITEIKKTYNTSEEELQKIASNIFDIASTNKFFSEIYAKLYKSLMDEFPDIFTSILHECIQGFTETMKSFKYVDQNDNYDEFCKYNKENDKRKAISVFITNLVKTDVIPISTAIQLINELYDIIVVYMKESGKLNEVEEITENIYLLLTNYSEIMRESITELKPKIKQLSELKPKELPSMSSRSIFKYIDILDKMKKL